MQLESAQMDTDTKMRVCAVLEATLRGAQYIFALDKNIGAREVQFMRDVLRPTLVTAGPPALPCHTCRRPMPTAVCRGCLQPQLAEPDPALALLDSAWQNPELARREVHFTRGEKRWRRRLFRDLKAKRKVLVASCSAGFLRKLHADIRAAADDLGLDMRRVLVYVGDTDQEEREQAASDVNRAWARARCVLYSPCIEAGVSYTGPRRFFRVYGYLGQGSCTCAGFLQMLHRVRAVKCPVIAVLVSTQCSLEPMHAEIPLREVEELMAGSQWCDARGVSPLGGLGITWRRNAAQRVQYPFRDWIFNVHVWNVWERAMSHAHPVEVTMRMLAEAGYSTSRMRFDGACPPDGTEAQPSVYEVAAGAPDSDIDSDATDDGHAGAGAGSDSDSDGPDTYLTDAIVAAAPSITAAQAAVLAAHAGHTLWQRAQLARHALELEFAWGIHPLHTRTVTTYRAATIISQHRRLRTAFGALPGDPPGILLVAAARARVALLRDEQRARRAQFHHTMQDADEGRALLRLEVGLAALAAVGVQDVREFLDPGVPWSQLQGNATRVRDVLRSGVGPLRVRDLVGLGVRGSMQTMDGLRAWLERALRTFCISVVRRADGMISVGPGLRLWTWPGAPGAVDPQRPLVGWFDPEVARALQDGGT